jgi:hypothetical protein
MDQDGDAEVVHHEVEPKSVHFDGHEKEFDFGDIMVYQG